MKHALSEDAANVGGWHRSICDCLGGLTLPGARCCHVHRVGVAGLPGAQDAGLMSSRPS